MLAVFKRELNAYYNNMLAYVFSAFLLLFIGLYTTIYNLRSSVANFEYVLADVCKVFVILVPILTMKVISEERKQKTDQLLYSLPLSMSEIIIGKYLALLVVYLVPVLVSCAYPLILNSYGDVYLPLSYGSMVGFYFLGAALIAIGVFVSSLSENQAISAGISFLIMIFNYSVVSLSDYASSTEMGTFIFMIVMIILLTGIIYYFTKSLSIAAITGTILILAAIIMLILIPDSLQGVLPTLMENISLFERFYVFINGVFDLKSIVFFISVSIFFLYLTMQVMEKRRYN